jgi:SSS family solute:Na+ symporter
MAVSLVTRPRDERELAGLVYSLTERPRDAQLPWHRRPAVLGVVVLAATLLLNVVFF